MLVGCCSGGESRLFLLIVVVGERDVWVRDVVEDRGAWTRSLNTVRKGLHMPAMTPICGFWKPRLASSTAVPFRVCRTAGKWEAMHRTMGGSAAVRGGQPGCIHGSNGPKIQRISDSNSTQTVHRSANAAPP